MTAICEGGFIYKQHLACFSAFGMIDVQQIVNAYEPVIVTERQ